VFFAFASPPIDMRWVNKEIYRVRGGYLVASDSPSVMQSRAY
jgi:hypothetical protein